MLESSRAPEDPPFAAGRDGALRGIVLTLDALLILASMALAALAHEHLKDVVPLLRGLPSFKEYALLVYLALPLFLSMVVVTGMHRCLERRPSHAELLFGLAKLHVGVLVCLVLLVFVTRLTVNRSLVALFLSASFALLYAERAVLAGWLRFQHESGQSRLRLLLAGAPSEEMQRFVAAALLEPYPPKLVGYVRSEGPAVPPEAPAGWSIPLCGSAGELERVLREHAIDQVLFFPPLQRPADVVAPLSVCEAVGVPAAFAVDLTRQVAARPRIAFVYGHPFVTFELAPKAPAALALKHGADVLAAAVGVALLLPLLAAVSLAILATMGRPVLFRQERAGLQGRRFRLLKFRTMVNGAEQQRAALQSQNEMSGPVFKVRKDPRITRLGRLLRRTSIDELPQLLNVMAGQMSLVGPRPLPLHEQAQIRGWHRRRLSMKPGISGLWQVSGRNQIDFNEWMKLDLRYVDEWSLTLDFMILLKTLPTVLTGRGAS